MVETLRSKTAMGICAVLLATVLAGGCGAITVHHVPEMDAISSDKIPNLQGSRSLSVNSGSASAAEIEIGTVGVGKVVGRMQEWTNAAVTFVKAELSGRGATLVDGAPKALTLTVTNAELSAVPFIGVSNGKVSLMVVTADGPRGVFDGTGSSLAPLGAINGAATNAVKRMLEDPKISAYLSQ